MKRSRLIYAFGLCGISLLVAHPSLSAQEKPGSAKAPEISLDSKAVLQLLKEKTKVQGTATFDYVTKQSFAMTTKSPEWEVDVTLENQTPHQFALSSEMMTAQLDDSGEAGGSMLLQRGSEWLAPEQTGDRHPYRTYLVEHGFEGADGNILLFPGEGFAPMLIRGMVTPDKKPFGALTANGSKEFKHSMTPGSALKPGFTASVIISLPAAIARCTDGEFRFHALVTMRKDKTEGEKTFWSVQDTEWFLATVEGTQSLLSSTRAPFVQVLAANWLVGARGAQGYEALAKLVTGKTSGHLLASTLALGLLWGHDDLVEQASALAKSKDAPEGIQIHSRNYLDALGKGPNTTSLSPKAKPQDGSYVELKRGHALAQRFSIATEKQLVGIKLPDAPGIDQVQISIYHESESKKGTVSNSFVGNASGRKGWFHFQQVGLKKGTYFAVLEMAEGATVESASIPSVSSDVAFPALLTLEGDHPRDMEKWKAFGEKKAIGLEVQLRQLPSSKSK